MLIQCGARTQESTQERTNAGGEDGERRPDWVWGYDAHTELDKTG